MVVWHARVGTKSGTLPANGGSARAQTGEPIVMNNTNRGTRSNSSFRFTFKDRGESGGTLVMVTVSMAAIFGFAALSLDVGKVLSEQRKENVATDAGALAGVAQLPDTGAAIQEG